MNYNANFQILVQVHELHNIYMRRQGFASIRIEIVDESVLGLNYASPVQIISPKTKDNKLRKKAWIEGNAWMSSIMPIQYLDQVYKLNEIAEFNLVASVLPRPQNQNVYLRFTLLFQKIYSFDGSLFPAQHGVETVIIKLKNMQSGIFHYGESYFSNQYYSKFTFTCFAVNSYYLISNKMLQSNPKYPYLAQTQQGNHKNTIKDYIEQNQGVYSNCKGKGIQFLYETYAKNLRYNSQLLQIRVNQNYKMRKQTTFVLPKFIKQPNAIVSQKQFFYWFANFDSSNIDVEDYQDEIEQMRRTNEQLVNSVAKGLVNQLFSIRRLRQQYNKYDRQIKTWRMMKTIEYGQSEYKQSQNAHDVVQNMRKYRKQVEKESQYPFQFQNWKRQIFMKYGIYLPMPLINKQLHKAKNNLPYFYDQTKMVVVICHGYLSSGAQMRMLKRGISSVLPFAQILVSRSNQTHTEGCLEEMGQRLAAQIDQFIIKEKLDPAQVIISFVGHSMGGIIARASFKHIPHLHQRFGFYCSIGTPHLGYLNGGLTKAGLWVMRKVKKQCKSLDQLSMYEAQHPELSFLYNLSSEGNLKCFKKIILISSAEDKFVPWHSARVCEYKTKKVNFYIETDMIQNIIGKMPTHRIDINFGMHKSDIQTMIGRKAHLNLITHYQIFDLVNQVQPSLFDITQI